MSTYFAQITTQAGTYSMSFADHASFEWEIVHGYVAPIQSWLMSTADAKAIMAGLVTATGIDREATLKLGDPNDFLNVKRVYVVGTAPSDNPQRMYLLLADIRIYLGFLIFIIDLNVRRRLGDVRLVGPDLLDPNGAAVSGLLGGLAGAGGSFVAGGTETALADSIGYSPWSIDAGKAYTWSRARDQALAYLAAPRHGRPAIGFTIDAFSLSIEPQVIQETTTDSDGTIGLARVIESVPGAGVYVDVNGILHVYDATPGAEKSLVEALPKTLDGHGDLQWADLSGLRPSLWRLRVDYAAEVRFNYQKPFSAGKDISTDLDNVLQVTDRTLRIPVGPWGPERTVGQGTWITFEEAFAAWGGKQDAFYGALPALTDDLVADHWFGDALQRYAIGGFDPLTGGLQTDSVWASRIQEVMRCYRTYFRVNHAFWDTVRHFWVVRAAIWDTVTGTRAPSPVYSNFNLQVLNNFSKAELKVFGVNVTNSVVGDGLLAEGHPSGFRVFIEDSELMVIGIERDLSRFPGHTKIAPSPTINGIYWVKTDGAPGLNEAVNQRLVHMQGTSLLDPDANDWSLSTVMTCAPASPNDLRRTYEVVVTLPDAMAAAGLVNTPVCNAPDQELRSLGVEARVAYQDTPPEIPKAILQLFGNGNPGAIGPEDPVRTLRPINLKSELIPLAAAMAAANLIPKLDRYEGTKAVPMTSSCAKLVPIGSINKVVHKVTENRAISIVHAEPSIGHWDATEFLKGSARSYLLKQIQDAR